jgi:hypothetical protein
MSGARPVELRRGLAPEAGGRSDEGDRAAHRVASGMRRVPLSPEDAGDEPLSQPVGEPRQHRRTDVAALGCAGLDGVQDGAGDRFGGAGFLPGDRLAEGLEVPV